MSITFFGGQGAEKAVLNLKKEIVMGGLHAYIRFENLTVQDGGAQYLFNQGADANVTELKFSKCELNDFERSVVRLKDQKAITIDNLTFDNCIVFNQGWGSQNYALINMDAKEYTINKMTFNNTVFNTLKYNVILLNHKDRGLASVDEIEINNCTFYNYIGKDR